MGDTGITKQEQEPADERVAEVAPDVLRMQLPISMPGLGHVNAYALLDDRGVAVVDPGMPGPGTWSALTRRLADAGLRASDVHTILITHSHPDHFGGAGRLADEANGAAVVTHSAFRAWGPGHDHDDTEVDDVDPEDLPQGNPWERRQPWGGTPHRHGPRGIRQRARLRAMRTLGRTLGRTRAFSAPVPTERVKNGDVLKLAGREWFALHTPGHTLDHLCLYDPEARVLLSGDHVLPTITPHISGMGTGRDPLGLFFASLDKVAALDVATVLPAHGHPFSSAAERAQAIKEHHLGRLGTLREVCSSLGPTTVVEYSHHLFRRERWGSMAESETYAHLEHLRLQGEAERYERGGELVYEISPE